jgi:hypothetical protein
MGESDPSIVINTKILVHQAPKKEEGGYERFPGRRGRSVLCFSGRTWWPIRWQIGKGSKKQEEEVVEGAKVRGREEIVIIVQVGDSSRSSRSSRSNSCK